MDLDLTPFKRLIKEKTGLSFGASRSVKLVEAIRTAMSAKGIHSPAEFYSLIFNSHFEFVEMVNLLTVNETYFFREPVHLKLLSERLAPELLRRGRRAAKIRILSAGCSTGEEPYSLVIALMERLGLTIAAQFEFIGADIDSDAIHRARKSIYGNQSFRGFDQTLKNKYFDSLGNGQYKLKDFVKRMVELKVFNLSSDLYPEELCNLDVIFYRNVSIYFEPDTQRRIFSNLSRRLNNGGYFITSATETLSHNLNILSLTEWEGTFYYEKSNGPVAKKTAPLRRGDDPVGSLPKCSSFNGFELEEDDPSEWPLGTPSRKSFFPFNVLLQERMKFPPAMESLARATGNTDGLPPGLRAFSMQDQAVAGAEDEQEIEPRVEHWRQKSIESIFDEALSLAKDKQYEQAISLIEKLTARDPSFVRGYSLMGNLLINLERLEEAERACLKAVEIDELWLEGYLLLGLIAKKRSDHATSVKRFKEALYVRPSCWLAHFYLAEIYHSRKEFNEARREYSIILKLLESGRMEDPGLSFFPLSIPMEQMMHLCRHKLEHLKAV
jgi:chemotaxis protein methyltransferase CheR